MKLPPIDELARGVRAGNRAALGRAITLVESTKPAHAVLAQALLRLLASPPQTAPPQTVPPQTVPPQAAQRSASGASAALVLDGATTIRVGVTGVPGVGKSTFIEGLGVALCEAGHRVAVLAVDPSSSVHGGSILGDKTRMSVLSCHPRAYVRPSPTGGSLGGVHRRTRETIRVVEAAGYDVVLVETVGVGQSEIAVASMVDTFLVLMLAGAGDELQGIKKGILEVADLLAVNKADGDNALPAKRARSAYAAALRLVQPTQPEWRPRVLTCSGQSGDGVEVVWQSVLAHRRAVEATGALIQRRRRQDLAWMWAIVESEVVGHLRRAPAVQAAAAQLEAAVQAGQMPPTLAAWTLLDAYNHARGQPQRDAATPTAGG